MTTDELVHHELRCVWPPCEFDMRDNPETADAVARYLSSLVVDIQAGRIRHVSASVHRVEEP